MKSIEDKINILRKNLLKYEYYYHTLDQSLVSDAEYDYLFNQLYNLELQNKEFITPDSPTQKIGSYVKDKFRKVIHFSPMLSLNNIFNLDGYVNFEKQIKRKIGSEKSIFFYCELKLDGVAISIIYEQGYLVRAATRGNGYIGENVTENARMIPSIPFKIIGSNIPQRLEIRGEVCMLKSDFIKLNQQSNLNKEKIFSNPRNAASGSLRHLNPQVTKKRNLVFFCHGYNFFEKLDFFKSHYEMMQQCKIWGFPIIKDTLISSSCQEIYQFYKACEKKRSFFDFNIDGIVIKVDSIKLQHKLGNTNKAPRWAVALKFFDQEKITQIIDVKFQVGRTGIITPVAYLKPILIAGVIIKKASLHNKNEINRLQLHLGDFVVIRRSGDVIPKIIRVVTDKKNKNLKKISFPLNCPSCKNKIIFRQKDKIIRCHSGLTCSAQKQQALCHFFSKNALNARGVGSNFIKQLIKNHLIFNVTDFFYLTPFQLQTLKYIKNKQSEKICKAIAQSKKTTFQRFIFALGIPHVGITVSENITNSFMTLDMLMNASVIELSNLPGVGEIIAQSIFDYFSIIKNCRIIIELTKKIGVSWNRLDNSKTRIKTSFFLNKKIVLTGTFSMYSRENLKIILKNLGGRILTSISRNTDLLIYGKKSGSKLSKALILKVNIMNEKELSTLLGIL